MKFDLYNDNCLTTMKTFEDNSVDSIVTDPPYGLSFMGKKWDYDVPSVEIWKECLRVLKPGGHLLSFAGTRTQHRMAVNIEDAGFEIRDMLAWIYGSGFPKSLNISKGIDKRAGAVREVIGVNESFVAKTKKQVESGQDNMNKNMQLKGLTSSQAGYQNPQEVGQITAPNTDEAKKWDGWGTALKPALEPITLARKPIAENTIIDNVLKYGTGGINIDGSRIDLIDIENHKTEAKSGLGNNVFGKYENPEKELTDIPRYNSSGRFPANLLHDGSDEVVKLFPETSSGGSTSRFFYCAKTSKSDRNDGCNSLKTMSAGDRVNRKEGSAGMDNPRAGAGRTSTGENHHPTVKPTDLMRYLVKLITPKDGVCLDPFMGSGSTGKACKIENFNFIGIDLDPQYVEIARKRIEAVKTTNKLF